MLNLAVLLEKEYFGPQSARRMCFKVSWKRRGGRCDRGGYAIDPPLKGHIRGTEDASKLLSRIFESELPGF